MIKLTAYSILFVILVLSCHKDNETSPGSPPVTGLEFLGDSTYTENQAMNCEIFVQLYIGKELHFETLGNTHNGEVTFKENGTCISSDASFISWKYNASIINGIQHTFCNSLKVKFIMPGSSQTNEEIFNFYKYEIGQCRALGANDVYIFYK